LVANFFSIGATEREVEELPKVVQEKRRRERQCFIGSLVLFGVMFGCTYYIVRKLGLSPF
jgi:hypothetical protein